MKNITKSMYISATIKIISWGKRRHKTIWRLVHDVMPAGLSYSGHSPTTRIWLWIEYSDARFLDNAINMLKIPKYILQQFQEIWNAYNIQ